MTRMTSGANIALTSERFTVRVGWRKGVGPGIDVAAVLLTDSGKVTSTDDFVRHDHPAHPSGAVWHQGKVTSDVAVTDAVVVDLARAPESVHTVAVAAFADRGTFGESENLRLTVTDGAGALVAVFPISTSSERAMITGEFYRRYGAWKFRAVGHGYAAGLAALAADFGIILDDQGSGTNPSRQPPAIQAAEPVPESTPRTSVMEVVSGARTIRRVERMGMQSIEDGDQPYPTDAVKPVGYWSARVEFESTLRWGDGSGSAMQLMHLTITDRQVLAIVTQIGVNEDLWISQPRSTVTVQARGKQGLRGRPGTIELIGDGWRAVLRNVDRIFRSSGAYQSGQERSLYKALTAK